MLNKLNDIKITKNEIIMITLIFIIIIIGIHNGTFAFFSTQKDTKISVSSKDTFENTKVIKSNVILEGELSHTTDKTKGLNTSNTISIQLEDVTEYDYLVTLATQIDPHNTNFLETFGSSIKYEVYHKTDTNMDTSNLTCESKIYISGEIEDYCQIGTFENKLDGTPFDIMTNYRISDTNIHYFDVYIYLSNESIGTSKLKTSFFFLTTPTDKPVPQYIESPDISGGLVPIKYNGTKWVVTTEKDPEWYNYNEQKWANAAILKNKDDNVVGNELILPVDSITESQSNVYAMFVWIPRFSYTIGCLNSDTDCFGYRMMDDSDKDSRNPTSDLPGAIDIKFVLREDKLEIPDMDNGIYPNYTYTSETDRTSTNWYTHPAFWWDKNGDGIRAEDNSEELSGIWVGKFETSTNSSSTCYTSESSDNCNNTNQSPRILPNVISLRYQSVYNQFETAKKFSESGNIYGIDNEKADSHMMKNSEWGAVAYLSQSIYGKYGNKDYNGRNKEIYNNNSSSYYTGISSGTPSTTSSSSITCRYNVIDDRGSGKGACGTGASTTGNIYGIYDMSGGASEYVMAYYENAISGTSSPWGASGTVNYAGFTNETKPLDKYFNGYQYKTILTKSKEVVGHATYETSEWYLDSTDELAKVYPWLVRGKSDFFEFDQASGKNLISYTFRSVLLTIAS